MGQSLREKITDSGNLPTLPAAALYILQLANNDKTELTELAAGISKDPALSVKVLRAVNSSFYGMPQKVSTVSQAVVLLGLHAVKALVLGFTLLNNIRSNKSGFDHLSFWRRSMYAATAARIIAGKVLPVRQEDCFVAALLMDVGTLLLDQMLGDTYSDLCERAGCHADLLVHEVHELGMTHAEVAATLAEHWKLPEMLAIPMGKHHGPREVDNTILRKITEVVWLAGRCADIFSHDNAAESISAVRASCKELYTMDELAADAMLCNIGQKTAELAKLFDVRLNSSANFDTILTKASERLLELSIAQQEERTAGDNKRRSSRMRRDGKITVTPCARGVLGQPVQLRLRDLSAAGIGLTHTDRMEPGSQFVIRLPEGEGAFKTLLYTVRRCDSFAGLSSIGAELTSVLRPESVRAAA
jgi:HD-like signal output (HDOD) protein